MFKRRIPLSPGARFWRFLWPQLGWKRAALYHWHRLLRLPGTTSALAAGFACGAAVSFLPLNGLHFLLAALLAWMMRASVIASAFGTIIGNPWTFPPIWLGTYWLGQVILGHEAHSAPPLQFGKVFDALWYGVIHLDGAHIAQYVWPVWWPMMVGGVPVAVVVWFAFYIPMKRAMTSYNEARGLRRLQRLADQARRELPHDEAS